KPPLRFGNPRFRPPELIAEHFARFHKAQPLQYSNIYLRVWIRRSCCGRWWRGVRRYCSGFEAINKGTKRRDHPFGLPVFALRHSSAGCLEPLQGSSLSFASPSAAVLNSMQQPRFETGEQALNFLQSLLGLLASASPCGSSSPSTLKLRLEFSPEFEQSIRLAHGLGAIGQPGFFPRPETPIHQIQLLRSL